ncbi:hypothetical protein VMD_36820 [Vibrio mimicus VM573]|nr:hypothetical protein VMD_36820 [Vibrio mimicus VM573]
MVFCNEKNNISLFLFENHHNARLRSWQRMTLNSNTTAVTTAAHWDWKRHTLTVPLEAFVSFVVYCLTIIFNTFS